MVKARGGRAWKRRLGMKNRRKDTGQGKKIINRERRGNIDGNKAWKTVEMAQSQLKLAEVVKGGDRENK